MHQQEESGSVKPVDEDSLKYVAFKVGENDARNSVTDNIHLKVSRSGHVVSKSGIPLLVPEGIR